jgi:hypothetical protein
MLKIQPTQKRIKTARMEEYNWVEKVLSIKMGPTTTMVEEE